MEYKFRNYLNIFNVDGFDYQNISLNFDLEDAIGAIFLLMMNLSAQLEKMKPERGGVKKMSEDPLRFMLTLIGFMDDVGRYKLYCIFLATVDILYMLVPSYRLLRWYDMYCLPELFLRIPPILIQILSIYTADNILKFSKEAIAMNSTAKNFTKECKMIRNSFISLCIISMLVYLTFLPIVGDEGKFICQFNVVKEWSNGKYYTFYVFTAAILLAVNGWHFLQILNQSVEEINKFNGGDDVLNDMEYQNMIYHKLTQCVKHHIRIKNLSKTLLPLLENMPMFSISVSGLIEMAFYLYFIISKFSPPSNFRMVLAIFLCASFAFGYCWGGQYLSDESNRFHNLLCESKWFNWNKKNRQCLLIILPATAKPMKMSCFGLYDLNLPYILLVGRVSYSLLAVAMKFN